MRDHRVHHKYSETDGELEERLGVLEKAKVKVEEELQSVKDAREQQVRHLNNNNQQLELQNQKLHRELIALQARSPDVRRHSLFVEY